MERPTVKNGPDMVASKISRAENFLLREETNSLTSSRTNEPAPRFVWFDRGGSRIDRTNGLEFSQV